MWSAFEQLRGFETARLDPWSASATGDGAARRRRPASQSWRTALETAPGHRRRWPAPAGLPAAVVRYRSSNQAHFAGAGLLRADGGGPRRAHVPLLQVPQHARRRRQRCPPPLRRPFVQGPVEAAAVDGWPLQDEGCAGDRSRALACDEQPGRAASALERPQGRHEPGGAEATPALRVRAVRRLGAPPAGRATRASPASTR